MSNHSVQGKEWVLKDFDKNLAEYISKEYDLDFLTSRLLANRNINQKNIENFLNPKIKISYLTLIILRIWEKV